jgi:hypothetical protein
MISAKRIVSIFRQTGGSGEFTKSIDELTDAQVKSFPQDVGKETPLIVSMRSADEWFVLTPSHLVLKDRDVLRRVPLEHVEWIVTPEDAEFKSHGGKLGVLLRDGSAVSLHVEAGRPYVSLMNVFMYIARVAGPPSHRALTGAWRAPTKLL